MRKAKWTIREQLADIQGLKFRNIIDPAGDIGPFLITTYKTPEPCKRFTDALPAEGMQGPQGSLVCVTVEQWGLYWHFNNLSLVHRRSLSNDGWPWTHPANVFAKGNPSQIILGR